MTASEARITCRIDLCETLPWIINRLQILYPDISMHSDGTYSLILLLTCSKRATIWIASQYVHPSHRRSNQIRISQSGYDTDHQLLMVLKCPSSFWSSIWFLIFFPEILYTVIPVNILVRLRIIYIIVDSIQYRKRLGRPGLHQSFSFSVKRSLNFLCIGAIDEVITLSVLDDTAL